MKMGLQQILIKDVADKQLLAICSRSAPEKQVRQRTSRALLFTSVLLASSMASTASQAGDDKGFERQLGSHQHGEAHLDIALDGNELVLSFTSPAANIVGFEYEPKTDKERQKVSDAKQFLLDAESWLGVPAAAGCTLKEATFTASAEDHDDHDHDHEKHDDHDHEKHDDHDHEKHDDHDHENTMIMTMRSTMTMTMRSTTTMIMRSTTTMTMRNTTTMRNTMIMNMRSMRIMTMMITATVKHTVTGS